MWTVKDVGILEAEDAFCGLHSIGTINCNGWR